MNSKDTLIQTTGSEYNAVRILGMEQIKWGWDEEESKLLPFCLAEYTLLHLHLVPETSPGGGWIALGCTLRQVWIFRKRIVGHIYLEAIFCPKAESCLLETSGAPLMLRIWVSMELWFQWFCFGRCEDPPQERLPNSAGLNAVKTTLWPKSTPLWSRVNRPGVFPYFLPTS